MAEIYATAHHCETAFYAAFNALDYEQMSNVWAAHCAVWCVHPAGPVLHGRDAVMSSWRQIFAAPASLQFSVSDHQVIEDGDLAVRFVHENIHHGAGLRSLSVVQATNVFVREGSGWKLCSHHASPAPQQTGVHRPQTPDGTMH